MIRIIRLFSTTILCTVLLLAGCGGGGGIPAGSLLVKSYTISGNVGVAGAGATLSYTDGSAKTVTADASGNYKLTVTAGWSGSVTPTLAGAAFIPAELTYTNVTADQINQDFTALPTTLTISGNAGAPDAVLSYTDIGNNSIVADSSGNYSFPVSYNWSGTVTVSLAGYAFTPASRTYSNLTTDLNGQNYAAAFTLTTYLSDGFESGGWTMTKVSGNGSWSIVTAGTKPDATPHGGANMAKFNSSDPAAYGSQARYYRNADVAAPGSANTVLLIFYMYHDPDFSGSADTIQPQISTNGGAAWTSMGPAISRYSWVAGWTRHTVDVSAYSGQALTIGFLATSDYGNNMFIDDISVAGGN